MRWAKIQAYAKIFDNKLTLYNFILIIKTVKRFYCFFFRCVKLNCCVLWGNLEKIRVLASLNNERRGYNTIHRLYKSTSCSSRYRVIRKRSVLVSYLYRQSDLKETCINKFVLKIGTRWLRKDYCKTQYEHRGDSEKAWIKSYHLITP